MRALDAATGKTIWETKYNATYKPNPAATRTHGTGPKSTPTLADGRLFTLGMTGAVTAFDVASGKQLWQNPAGRWSPCITPRCRRWSTGAS
jgi:outer membrane protein assembly factor BamB